ncbi:conjugal transfer protein [Nibricoccus aquaticus]|uniref:Conjugal transfer protein n=1 Tax=Nibricoccus aquaticus TaxID=2576891 RepID=A0A290Q7I5_9BACT|nr:MobF family relaxase [Nibricoccus aquaticus]ATC63130.1 conjugal transfer protein [Nibricoccus aquaticus]
MIQTKVQFNLKNAQQYFREHLGAGDYYSEGQKVTGEWLGNGAEKLGLKGAVGEDAFLALCEGQHPETKLRLGQRLNSVRQEGDEVKANRRIFFDFTIAPPKSVSVVALYQDERIVGLHECAVRAAMHELEKRAEARIRKSGQNSERITGDVVTACFRHETSRELDPHLHTHCVVFNQTFDPVENCWKALHAAGMYRAHRFATNLYRHELCKGLRALGYEIENHARGFEIKGVPQSVIERFSKRHQQIDQETRERLAKGEKVENLNDLRERVAHGNRRRKLKNSSADRLRETWGQQMQPDELSALHALKSTRSGVAQKVDVAGMVVWAEQHLFERRAVVHDHELMAAALERGRGADFDLGTLRAVIDQRGYVREKGTDKLTSRETLGWELEVVMAAREGRNQHTALSPHHETSVDLSAEQKVAVERILRSRDLITLFRGGAGTGKSFALKEVERGLVAAARPVIVLAPQRQQVQDLQADGLSADTLANFLQQKQLPREAVVMVDEAGQIGARQLGELVRVVKAQRGRLILSGDTRQHGSVAASDALRAIEKHAGLKPAVIHAIRRQDPKLGETIEQRTFIRDYRNAVKLAADGKIADSFDALDRLGCVREVSDDSRREVIASEYVASVGRKERTLVVAQTREEVRQINEAIHDKLRDSGALGESSVLKTYQPVDLDEAQKRDARFYQEGQSAYFIRGYGRFARGGIYSIVGTTEKGVIFEKDGVRSAMSFRYADRFIVAAEKETAIGVGERLQLKFNGKSREGQRFNNGELVTVREISVDGSLVVEGGKAVRKTLSPTQRLFTRGYAVTSYGSQGKTVDSVLLADAANRAATNAQQWYVSISRGRKRVTVFTADKEELRAHVQQCGERDLALDLASTDATSVDVKQSARARQSMSAVEHVRRHQAAMRATQNNHQHIHL